jgi:Tetracyclin repressor-like, C-terminal domain
MACRSGSQGADRVSRAGGTPPEQLIDPRLSVTAWLGMHNHVYLWLRAGGHFSVKDVAKSFADIFVWGIATRS